MRWSRFYETGRLERRDDNERFRPKITIPIVNERVARSGVQPVCFEKQCQR
jgi:hypothetical protein